MLILDLIQNVALLVALALVYEIAQRRWPRHSLGYQVISGLLFGGVGMIGMMTPMEFAPGIIYDGRSIILSVAGLFGGPVVAFIAALLCGAYRLSLGGDGAVVGTAVVVQSALMGVLYHYLRRGNPRWTSLPQLWVFGVLVHLGMLGIQLYLPGGKGWDVVADFGLVVLAVYPVATLVVCQVFLDTEKRLRMEVSLRESEAHLRRLIRLAPVPMCLVDETGRMVSRNERFVKVFGYDEKKVPTLAEWWERAYPDPAYRAEVRRKWEGLLERAAQEQADIDPAEYHVTCADGSERIVEISGILLDKSFLATLMDVTERRKAEQAAANEAVRRRVFFEQARDGIVVLNEDRGVVEANPSYAAMLGYTPEEMKALHVWDWDVNYPTREELVAQWPELPTSAATLESRQRRKDGSVIDVEITWNPAEWDGRRLLYCVVRDITERRAAETERIRLQERLQQSQKLESIGRLAGGVAHDFNNMLQSILGYCDLVLENPSLDEEAREYLAEIEKAAQRSASLTRQLLAFARRETVAPVPVDLNVLIPDMLKMLRRLIGEEIELHWVPANGLPSARLDANQLHQLLTNLALNARDAINGSGRIDIETHGVVLDEAYCQEHSEAVPGRYVVLSVSDDGQGMDRETLAHVFEPFFTTKGVGEGTGLGLATVYGIVKQNGGFINVYSEPGKGTTFRLHFPAIAQAPVAAPETPVPVSETGGTETILLVEDEPVILSLGKRLLTRLGYTVLATHDPAEALLLASRHEGKIDLLITDVVMPGMNGRDLARQVGEMLPGIRCLFMSGYTANVISRHGVLEEGVHFIQKPFTVEDLGRRVREVLDAPA